MRHVITSAIHRDPNIEARLNHRIDEVAENHQSLVVAGENGISAWNERVEIVVNCMWEGKARIDKRMGFQPDADWIMRVKYGFLLESTPELRELSSLIITNGAFGDIVNYPASNAIYITWYPACMSYIGKSDQLPEVWDAACDGDHPAIAKDIFKQSIDVLSEFVPQLQSLKLKQIMAGTIMGHGKTDITDIDSGLHCRHGIGVGNAGDYYSIFTGKYTSGPANAMELQSLLLS
jgi:hypothetical protein